MSVKVTLYRNVLFRQARKLSTPDRKDIALKIAADARAAAPVYRGDYRAGMGVEVSGDTIRAVDNDDAAIHKEYGTSDTPAHAALTHAAMKYGRYSGTRPRR